jgi:hypothetical protein
MKKLREETEVREKQFQEKIRKENEVRMKELEILERQLREELNTKELKLREESKFWKTKAQEWEKKLQEIENNKKENTIKFNLSNISNFYDFEPPDTRLIQNLVSNLYPINNINPKENFEKKKIKEILVEKILNHKKPIYLMINQAIEKLSNILKIKNGQYYTKKYIHKVFQKIEIHKTKPFKNIFNIVRSYKNKNKCFFCRYWILNNNFHKHIDECKKYYLEKDFCEKCKRYIISKIIINNKVFHNHVCYRKEKIIKKIKIESKIRWKRRKFGEKKIKRFFLKRKIHGKIEEIYLRKILSDFVNQRRKQLIEKIDDIKNGYPEEYLNLYRNETEIPYHFKQYFSDFIGNIGRFYGDSAEKTYFNVEKAQEIFKKYQSNFNYINGTSNEQETKRVKEEIKNSLLNLRKINIPKFRKVKVYADLTKTYLLACAQRREIDKEIGILYISN